MRVIYLVLLVFLPSFLSASHDFGSFMNKQMEVVKRLNDTNVTQELIIDIIKKQEDDYSKHIEKIILNKQKYFSTKRLHNTEINALEKIVKLNDKLGNNYAVKRDEVLIKSYQIIDLQYKMIQDIFKALDKYSYSKLQQKISEIFANNSVEISAINNVDYKYILDIRSDSKVLHQAKENVIDYYAILEVNSDVMKYMSVFDKKMYTLNKYAQYKLLKPILFINSSSIVKSINSVLSIYGFNVVKLILILILILFIYFIRTLFYNLLEKYIVNIESLESYSKDILGSVRRLVETLIIFINIEMVIYVYNDFVSILSVSKTFNMLYGFIFTIIVYKIANAIAKIRIAKIQEEDGQSIKFEVINIGIKMVNFTILILGLLLGLYLAGINLTAVLSGLGIGGFAVALAAKDSLANFFGTLNILFSDMFSQGDWIKLDGVEGTVVEIGLRVTTLRTFDNAIISIPNATVANKDIKNWNKRSLGRRIKMKLGVKYDSKPQDIQNAVKEIREMLDKHPGIATSNTNFKHSIDKHHLRIVRSQDDAVGVKKTLLVYLDEFGDSSINILIYCFSKTIRWAEWLEVKEDVMYKMMEILENNNLEFAFPSLSLYTEK